MVTSYKRAELRYQATSTDLNFSSACAKVVVLPDPGFVADGNLSKPIMLIAKRQDRARTDADSATKFDPVMMIRIEDYVITNLASGIPIFNFSDTAQVTRASLEVAE